jgi:hypothetical protein
MSFVTYTIQPFGEFTNLKRFPPLLAELPKIFAILGSLREHIVDKAFQSVMGRDVGAGLLEGRKMQKSKLKYGLLLAVAVALSACGDGKEIERISEKMKLNESEQYAFMICNRDMKVKLPVMEINGQLSKMTRLPLEICGCQSKTLAEVFQGNPGIKAGNVIFTSFAKKGKKGRLPKVPEELLKKGVTADAAITRLWESFQNCTTSYQSAAKEKAADLFEVILTKEQKHKLAEEKKAAHAAEAAKEKQASAE